MLYFNTRDGQHVLVLEPAHIAMLKEGDAVRSPNGAVLVLFTYDSAWLGEQIIANMGNLTPDLIDKLVTESQKRPEKPPGPYHPPMHVIESGKPVKHD